MTALTQRAKPAATAPMPTRIGAVAVAVLSLAPLVYLFATGTSFHDIATEFGYPAMAEALGQTVALTATICVCTVVLGVGCALLVVRTTLPAPGLFTVLFALPLAVPGFVSAYAAYSTELVYAPRLGFTTSFWGASVIMALTLFPYVFLPSLIALRNIDAGLEDVVASLRRHRIAIMIRVVIPALRPAVGGGVLIVALHVLSEYGGMVQLGRSTLTTRIMAEMIDYGDYRSARSLSLVLVGLAGLALIATRLLTGPGRGEHIDRGAVRPPRRRSLGRLRAPITVACLALPLVAVGPSVFMTVRGLIGQGRTAKPDWMQIAGAFATTFGYALAAALVATILALPVSWWVSRHPSRAANATERTVWIAHAIPSAILALSLIYFATRLVPDLYKTSVVLVAAYVILFLPLAVANQRVGLLATRRAYDDVAGSLGARAPRVFIRVNLPLALPGFVAGALLVALDASKELNTTLMLVPFNVQTLSTRLWATTNGESLDFTAAAPYAAMLILLGAPPVYLLVRQTLKHLGGVDPVAAAHRGRAMLSREPAE